MTKDEINELKALANKMKYMLNVFSTDEFAVLVKAIRELDTMPSEDGTDPVRDELLERGEESVTFRQLVERFDEVDEEFGGKPWTSHQTYNNFNILIGEKPCGDTGDT